MRCSVSSGRISELKPAERVTGAQIRLCWTRLQTCTASYMFRTLNSPEFNFSSGPFCLSSYFCSWKSIMIYFVISVTRSIYQTLQGVDVLNKKKTVTALKPGEDRAVLLGLAMILASFMMYFVLGITILRSYAARYWPDVSVTKLFFVFKWKLL